MAGILLAVAVIDLRAQPHTLEPQVRAFVIAFRADVVAAAAADALRERVRVTLGAGWDVRTITRDQRRLEVAPAAASVQADAAGPVATLSVAEAWEKAHALAEDVTVAYAEPAFVTIGNSGEQEAPFRLCPPCAPDTTATGRKGRPLKEALADSEWSIGPRGANVIEAWELLTKAGGTFGGGVTVVQPDTGVRRHPELPSDGQIGVFPSDGWDFVNDRPGANDELTEGFLRFPGHGTKTSSVIASPRRSQFTPLAARWVSGVAASAHLIPLRVAEGVILSGKDRGPLKIDITRLANAVWEASADTSDKVARKADVISVSMGGLAYSHSLLDALRYAERQGVIVVTAAGNQVRVVVWPARYPTVVSVAASNYAGRPWSGSSRGRSVKITAPGESVWTASVRPGQECVTASDGTSFATATTAGIAALWISYVAKIQPAEFQQAKNAKRLPVLFRAAIRAGARPVDARSRDRFGAGIIDAAAVLRAGLGAGGAAVAATEPTWCENPKADEALAGLKSLFDVPDGRVRAQRLFGPHDLCRSSGVADEIAFLHSIHPDVTEAIDDLVESPSPDARDYQRGRRRLLAKPVSAALQQVLTGPR